MLSFLALSALLYCSVYAVPSQLNVTGLVTAVLTPFDSQGRLNVAVVPEQAKFLSDTGVEYAFVAGTTGESVTLSQKEREQLLEAWINVAPQYKLKVIAHVGANCLEESRQLAAHAVNLNSSSLVAIAAMATSFFKPASIHALTETMSKIASAAPTMPFYYYHIPSMTGVEFGMYDFMTFAGQHIPNLMGIKWTGLYDTESSFPDMMRLLNYNENGKTYEVMSGREEMMIQGAISGVKGFVGSQFNFAGQLYNNILKAFNSGNYDEARTLQLYGVNLLAQVEQNLTQSGRNGVKYMMVEAGVDVGDARLPYEQMDDAERQREQANTLAWCKETNDALDWCKNLRGRA